MRSKILCTLAAAALAWAAAAQPITPVKPDDTDVRYSFDSLLQPATQPVDSKSAIARWRQVGLSERPGECPAVPGWVAESLLTRALYGQRLWTDSVREWADIRDLAKLDVIADIAELRRLELDRLCIYTAETSDLEFPRPAGLADAKPDRMAVAPAGADLGRIGQQSWQILARHFLAQAGKEPLGLSGEPRVRLVFLDTQPDGEGVPDAPGLSSHGYTLAHLARRLVCEEGRNAPCAAEIATREALPHPDFRPDQPSAGTGNGGNVGLLTDLAEAIVREVWSWRRSGSSQHLILNLSLGWDGEMFGDLKAGKVSQLEPSVRAVYNALRFASRSGALVIAAAGNRRGGPISSNWPLLPAAWDLRRPDRLPFGLGRKPVYAVGGVDWQGLPLSNFRRGGRPRRVAYADHAVAETGSGGTAEPTAMYTGTSVSAAVTSSIAAVVWHLRPELRPAQVMRLVVRSGDRLPSRADFYPWRKAWLLSKLLPAPRQHRVSLCKAVKRSCGDGAARCPDLAGPPQCRSWDQEPPQLTGLASTLALRVASAPRFEIDLPPFFIPPCDPSTRLLVANGDSVAAPCPTEQYGSIASQRWTAPTPEENPCPGCPLTPRQGTSFYNLDLEISSDWEAEDIQSATLDIDRFVAGQFQSRRTYPVPVKLAPGEVRSILIPGDGLPLTGCTAQLNFVVLRDGQLMSVQSPVVVDP